MDKLAYLKGLLEGLGVHPESREGKILYAVCAALDETTEYVKKLENRVTELEELCDILDEDLGTLEEQIEDTEAYGCVNCPSESKISYRYHDDEETDNTDSDTYLEDEEEEYETICPTCGKVILLNEQMLEDGETICPNCGEELEFDFDEEEVQRLAPDNTDSTDTDE